MRLQVNMVVSSAEEACEYYKNLLQVEILSTSHDNGLGMNETMIKMGETEIKVLDQNESLGLVAPKQVGGGSVWVNIYVEDIDSFFNNAVEYGASVISPVQEFPGPAKNAVFSDKFNHVWVVNQQY